MNEQPTILEAIEPYRCFMDGKVYPNIMAHERDCIYIYCKAKSSWRFKDHA